MGSFLWWSRYRRSYDSQFTAAVVKYHVWPALVEGDVVLIKGEAVTKRAALVPTSICWFEDKPAVYPRASYSVGVCLVLAVEPRPEPEHQPCALSLPEPHSQSSKSLMQRREAQPSRGPQSAGFSDLLSERLFHLGPCSSVSAWKDRRPDWMAAPHPPSPPPALIPLHMGGLFSFSKISHIQILSFCLLTCTHHSV